MDLILDSDNEISFDENDVSFARNNIIVTGNYSKIYIHKHNGNDYVIKTVKKSEFYYEKDLLDKYKRNNLLHYYYISPKIHKIVIYKNGNSIMIMDYCKGSLLSDLIYDNKLNTKIINQLFGTIQFMHRILESGHGDFNPANIFYTPDHFFKFIDIGTYIQGRPKYYDYITLFYYYIIHFYQYPSKELIEKIVKKIFHGYHKDKNEKTKELVTKMITKYNVSKMFPYYDEPIFEDKHEIGEYFSIFFSL